MNTSFFKKLIPHLIANLAFIAVLFVYYYPSLSGKTLVQNDVVQSKGFSKEAEDYAEKTGEDVLWTNSSFSGMPIWVGHKTNYVNYIHQVIRAVLPPEVLVGWLGFIGFYVLMSVVGANVWLAFSMSAAFVFSTFNIISFEAGHINKVYDMALMAPVLAGVWLVYRNKQYVLGAFVTTLFLALQIFYGHYQISYYLMFILVFMGIYELYQTIKEKEYSHFIKSSLLVIACAFIAVAPNSSKMWTNYEYSKNTIRGGSELSTKKTEGGGLDKDYALSWSNQKSEVLTTFIPYFYGGGSNENLSVSSETFKALVDNGVPRSDAKEYIKNIPLYWGDQPFTAGPIYFGAVVFFLFVLGMFIIKERYKWWIFAVTLFAFMMSWGKNFELLTDFLFYNMPLYNKFRSVTMAMCIAQMTFPFLAGLALVKIAKGEIEDVVFYKGLKWALGLCGGIALLFALFGGAFFNFVGPNDANMGLPDWMVDAVRLDRASKLRTDAFRSLFFVLVTAALLWAWFTDKLKAQTLYLLLAVLVIIDLAWVDKRYLTADDFEKRGKNDEWVEMTAVDEQILRDKDLSYRVFNVSKSPFNDATTSYYHKSIGGYSAIKLSRYQDLIEKQLSKNNLSVLNMLNARYVIVPDKKSGEVFVQRNPGALGNAWFVSDLKKVNNADEEMAALDSLNPATTLVVDKRFDSLLTGYTPASDSSARITLIDNANPNQLVYEYNSSVEQLTAFSEIYYQPGWNAYIDGKLVPHFRANYVLRAMRIPAGKHQVIYKFEPAHYALSERVAMFGSWLFVAFMLSLLTAQLLLMFRTRESK